MAEADTSGPRGDLSRVPVLDGIRGLAILMVLLCHFSLYGGIDPTTTADWIFYKLTIPLGCGVELFFVLSGFLITGILLDTKSAPGYFRSFYMRRLLRIFPLYYGTLFFFYVILPRIAMPGESYQEVLQAQAWDWAYLSNIRLALEGWWSAGYLGHFWSLAIEEQFYLAWPLLVLLFSRRGFLLLCAGLLGLSVTIRWGQWIDGESLVRGYFTFARLDPLVMGAALAALARSPQGLVALRPWARVVGVGSLAALTYLITTEHTIGLGRGQVVPDLFGGRRLLPVDYSAMEAIAEQTGGEFFRALDADALREVYVAIDRMEKVELEDPRYRTSDGFALPLLLGVAALALSLLIEALWIRGAP